MKKKTNNLIKMKPIILFEREEKEKGKIDSNDDINSIQYR